MLNCPGTKATTTALIQIGLVTELSEDIGIVHMILIL
jgi:hypothetical protein